MQIRYSGIPCDTKYVKIKWLDNKTSDRVLIKKFQLNTLIREF